MIRLDQKLIVELGLQSLPADHKSKLLQAIYDELEIRVGTAITEQMTDYQVSDFARYTVDANQAEALSWLEENIPHYKEIVAEEFEKLRNEISALRDEISTVSTFYAE